MEPIDPIFSVLIVDDHPLTRAGLKGILSKQKRYKISETLTSGASVIPFIKSTEVDIILLDINLPDICGTSLLAELVGVFDMTTIILTGETSIKDMDFALKMGARAIVSKSDPARFVVEALNKVVIGETYLSPEIARILSTLTKQEVELSSRQMAILQYMSQGETNKEICFRLKIAPPTVSFHVKQIREKLGVSGNKKILSRAKQLGLI